MKYSAQEVLPCGGTAVPDGYGMRCTTCYTVVGSVGMPRDCRDMLMGRAPDERPKKSDQTGS